MSDSYSICLEYYITGAHEHGFENCQTCSQNGSSFSGSDSNSYEEPADKIMYFDGQYFYEAEEEDLNMMEELEMMHQLRDCGCCKGDYKKCNGDICKNMGACYCYIHRCQELMSADQTPQLQI